MSYRRESRRDDRKRDREDDGYRGRRRKESEPRTDRGERRVRKESEPREDRVSRSARGEPRDRAERRVRSRDAGRSERKRSREDERRRRDDRRDDKTEAEREREEFRRNRGRSDERGRAKESTRRVTAVVGGAVRNLRIDRHECRKAAIEFLIHNYDICEKYSNAEIEDQISDYIRTLEMERDYYAFTIEILKGLLLDRKYTVITDRWVMGILDDHLQAELRVPDLTILRVAGYELLTHPEIPTTVVINEVNVLAKMYCPERQSLIHAATNRMIETQISIGNELAVESGAGRKKLEKHDPMTLLSGLDQEAQLAVILLEQMRKQRKRQRSYSSSSSGSSRGSRSPSPKRVDTRPEQPQQTSVAAPVMTTEEDGGFGSSTTFIKTIASGGIKIKYSTDFPGVEKRTRETTATTTAVSGGKVNASTQTVKDPTIEPGVRIYRISSV